MAIYGHSRSAAGEKKKIHGKFTPIHAHSRSAAGEKKTFTENSRPIHAHSRSAAGENPIRAPIPVAAVGRGQLPRLPPQEKTDKQTKSK